MAERTKRGRPPNYVPPRKQQADPGPGGYVTKGGEPYTELDMRLLKEYASRNAQALSEKGHILEPAFKAALGIDGPNPRHSAHSVRGILRGLVANGPFALSTEPPATPRGGARGGAAVLRGMAGAHSVIFNLLSSRRACYHTCSCRGPALCDR